MARYSFSFTGYTLAVYSLTRYGTRPTSKPLMYAGTSGCGRPPSRCTFAQPASRDVSLCTGPTSANTTSGIRCATATIRSWSSHWWSATDIAGDRPPERPQICRHRIGLGTHARERLEIHSGRESVHARRVARRALGQFVRRHEHEIGGREQLLFTANDPPRGVRAGRESHPHSSRSSGSDRSL